MPPAVPDEPDEPLPPGPLKPRGNDRQDRDDRDQGVEGLPPSADDGGPVDGAGGDDGSDDGREEGGTGPLARGDNDPDDEAGLPPIEELGRIAVESARKLAFPLGLAVLVGLFLLVQSRLDRRDPKLTMAPVEAETLGFESDDSASR